MASVEIQSVDFRRLARQNCYRYGPFYVYSENYISLDSHNFPSYNNKEGTGAIEKFLNLMQGLGAMAGGNNPAQKLSKPLPGVTWQNDDLSLTISLQGTMYFTEYRDWETSKNDIRSEVLAQGWKQYKNASEKAGISVITYIPNKDGKDALFNDDPADAAGMAMMTSAFQHATNEGKMLIGYASGDKQMYAEAKARNEATLAGKVSGTALGVPGLGLGTAAGMASHLGAAIEAAGANMNSGMMTKWATVGHPVQLYISGTPVSQSVNGVLTNLVLTEKSYVVDSTSDGRVYPTEMDVNLTIKNIYGSLLTTSHVE